jgi:hypothetical protein
MTVDKLELKCWEYIYSVKDILKYSGKGIYGLDKIREKIHNEICSLSQLSKEETLRFTDNLDKLNFNGTKLYLKILDYIRDKNE